MAPPGGVDTIALPLLPDPKLARATSTPEWLRQQGMRVLWAPLFATRDGRRVMRSGASLDSLVVLLDAGGFNLLAGDASPESTDSLHVRWEERDAVRRAWADAVKRLQPTSVAWIPLLDYANARHAGLDSSRGARGEGLAAPCALDSTLWGEGLPSAFGALARLAAEQRTLVIALGLDVGTARSYSMGQEFCDPARRGEAGTRSRTPPATRRCATPACYPGTTAPWRTRLPPAPRRSGIGCCGSAGTSTSRSGWRNRRPIGSRSACSAASGFRTGRCSCSHRSYGPATCSRSTARAASTSYTR